MNIIPSPDEPGLLAVNVFTVRPENQQALIETICSAGDPADVPGLRAMHLLRSLDGTQVINHMQWESEEAFAAATATDAFIAATRERVHTLIERAGPNRYEVIDLSRSR
jgi:heme-degrading monooxygenase HmoA